MVLLFWCLMITQSAVPSGVAASTQKKKKALIVALKAVAYQPWFAA
jgi:hypothetical protein